MDVTITGLTRVQQPKPNTKGDTVLGYFDCETDMMTVEGAVLVKRASDGGITMWEPVTSDKHPKRRIKFSSGVRESISSAAKAVYLQFGGEV